MQINQKLKEKRKEILNISAKYGAYNLRVFGSVARGKAKPDSDLDLLVNLESGRSLFDHIALQLELEELFGCKVEVVNEKALHWYIRDQVLKAAIPL